jgi:hypothetical protein
MKKKNAVEIMSMISAKEMNNLRNTFFKKVIAKFLSLKHPSHRCFASLNSITHI